MRAPESEELRPGDFVKVRGTTNPAHHGGRAVVVAVHRAPGPPWHVVSLDVRYSARGSALRVDLGERGELARWDTPWQPEHTVEDEPHDFLSPGAADASAPVSRRKLVVGALAVLLPLTALGVWEHERPDTDPNPVVVQRAFQEGVRGTGTATASTSLPTPTPTATTRTAAAEVVVAWAAGPVPVVAGADGSHPTPLAGVLPAEGCRDAYVRDLMSYLPMGQRVDVAGAGWYRTDDGIDVNAELVRTGIAVPDATTAGSSATDAANLATLQDLAADAPHDCS
ncbi:hypothetical protein ACFQ46_05215 [Kineococcus sp. GCM10028916]|uniref:hypothetical protein n=1 Tax=Kineococcus sp. GCM10028916 TaxID=3273394 RepID=UPI003628B4E2